MSKRVLARAGALAFGALVAVGSANAADLSVVAPPAPMPGSAPVISWTGFYAGAVGAYAWGDSSAHFSAPSSITTWRAASMGLNGGLAGLTLGYNFNLQNNLVLGVEGDISAGRIGGTAFLPQHLANPNRVPSNTLAEYHQSYFATIRARLGWSSMAFGNPTLWYITGGVAFSQLNREINNSTVIDAKSQATHTGWTVGAGFEHMIAPTWSVKGEVLYADLGTQHYATSGPTVVTDVHVTDTLVRFGINKHF